jgi:hypothetical protein
MSFYVTKCYFLFSLQTKTCHLSSPFTRNANDRRSFASFTIVSPLVLPRPSRCRALVSPSAFVIQIKGNDQSISNGRKVGLLIMLFYIIGGYQCFDKVIEYQTNFNENELLYSCYISCTVSIEN